MVTAQLVRKGSIVDDVIITESRPSEILAALHQSAEAEREYLFAARDAEPGDLILVAWIGSEAVGYIAASDERENGLLIWEHVVVPAHRNRGLGERLLVEAVRRAVPGAVVQIDPLSELDLERVVDYYRRLGFNRDSAQGGIWATAIDVIRACRRRRSPESEAQTPVRAIVESKLPGVVTIDPSATIREAVSVLNEHRIGAVVASSDGSRVEGILSERDLLVGIDTEGARFLDRRVGEVITTDVVTCTSGDSIATVMDLMTACRVRHIPVTDTGRLRGIVSLGDVVLHRLREVERRAMAASTSS
jgi:CBS domain-containing protein/GNAT superfamily N-acetyltransferase